MTNKTERNTRGREILSELGRPNLLGMEMWETHRPLALGINVQLREWCPDMARPLRAVLHRDHGCSTLEAGRICQGSRHGQGQWQSQRPRGCITASY
jgi:hypothetical protein